MTELFDTSIDITYSAIVHGHNNHTTNWMLLKCDNNLRLIAYGVNGFRECRTELKDQVPLYGFIRIEDVYLFLDWQPSSVENEALNEHKNFHQALVDKFTSDDITLFQLTASNLDELNDNIINKLLNQHYRNNYDDKDSPTLESDISDDDDDDDDTYEQAIDDEKLRLQEEEEQKKLELQQQEEKRKKEEELENQRLQKLKQLEEDGLKMKQDMIDANNNGDVLINGYLSVKSHNSPLWKRRCIQIENKAIKISSEEKPKDQIKSISLTNIKRYGKCDIDKDCYITNAVVLETTDDEVWQLLADNQYELSKILMAIEICTS